MKTNGANHYDRVLGSWSQLTVLNRTQCGASPLTSAELDAWRAQEAAVLDSVAQWLREYPARYA